MRSEKHFCTIFGRNIDTIRPLRKDKRKRKRKRNRKRNRNRKYRERG